MGTADFKVPESFCHSPSNPAIVADIQTPQDLFISVKGIKRQHSERPKGAEGNITVKSQSPECHRKPFRNTFVHKQEVQ
jgi:hypothetical protein